MAWVEIAWDLNRFRENERDDETGLHFAIVTVIDGQARVHGHSTGDLSQVEVPEREAFEMSEWIIPPGFWGRIRSQRNVPDGSNPFIGLVVRAVEYDNSSSAERTSDYERFVEDIRVATQQVVDSGELPTAEKLWSAGHAHGLTDNFGDDDDRLGVSARVDHDWGTRLTGAIETEDSQPRGTPLGGFRGQTLRFMDEGADYRFYFNWKLRAGRPGTDPEFVTQQHRGALPDGPRDI